METRDMDVYGKGKPEKKKDPYVSTEKEDGRGKTNTVSEERNIKRGYNAGNLCY
jgi:hypothetical protein